MISNNFLSKFLFVKPLTPTLSELQILKDAIFIIGILLKTLTINVIKIFQKFPLTLCYDII